MSIDDTSENGVKLAKEILKHNCNQNEQNANGYTPLALCVIYDNMEVAKMLVDNKADMYLLYPKQRDLSPFFIAVKLEKIWAVELFVDAGAALDVTSEEGYIPLFYASKFGYDDMCMYLSLRTNQDRYENVNGDTIFMQYMRKKDYDRLLMLLKRGSNINH